MRAFQELRIDNSSDFTPEFLDTLAEPVKYETLPADLAAWQAGLRMTRDCLNRLGFRLGSPLDLDQAPLSPTTSWSLMLHRGPLALLELRISDRSRFRPPADWAGRLMESGTAHVLCTMRGYTGSPDRALISSHAVIARIIASGTSAPGAAFRQQSHQKPGNTPTYSVNRSPRISLTFRRRFQPLRPRSPFLSPHPRLRRKAA
jgi:hypothetical protein